ncbi:MAG TPA: outer membrane lipoprotein carrier protein LolA [Bacteroidales bacterium]|nr:outer membrane lipoprotein carrier protein LolA [Bacteroidales bacterium]
MKKLFLFIILITITGLSAFSQREIKDGLVIDKQAQKLITDVASKLKTESPISFNFTQKSKQSTETGTIKLNANKYTATFLGNTIYCDGKSIFIYQKEINEVAINSIEDADNEILNISKFISEANTKFRPKLIREEKGNYIIDLTPKTKSEYSKIRLIVSKISTRISSMEINYKGGNTYTYTISNYKTKVQSKDSDYSFNSKEYPSVNVVDLR